MWKDRLIELLPLFGHRNWIIVADGAFPMSSQPGIETIHSFDTLPNTLSQVLEMIGKCPHLRPEAMLADELNGLPADIAEPLRTEVLGQVSDYRPYFESHVTILQEMYRHASNYRILMIKTHAYVPFTSAFLKLECGYWEG